MKLNNNNYTLSGIETCSDTIVDIPSIYNGKKVVAIGYNAFKGCDTITSVIIPDTVTTIGSYPFYNSPSLESIIIGSGVTNIGADAFE